MHRTQGTCEMYTPLEKTQLSRSSDPQTWKTHFNRMKDNNLTKRGKSVLVKGGGDGKKPTLKVISPSQQSVDIAKGELESIKETAAQSKVHIAHPAKTSKTSTPCKRAAKSWRRTPAKKKK